MFSSTAAHLGCTDGEYAMLSVSQYTQSQTLHESSHPQEHENRCYSLSNNSLAWSRLANTLTDVAVRLQCSDKDQGCRGRELLGPMPELDRLSECNGFPELDFVEREATPEPAIQLDLQLHLAVLLLSDTVSMLAGLSVDCCRSTVHNWIHKADLQPAEGRPRIRSRRRDRDSSQRSAILAVRGDRSHYEPPAACTTLSD
jgi:hypothetical protein